MGAQGTKAVSGRTHATLEVHMVKLAFANRAINKKNKMCLQREEANKIR